MSISLTVLCEQAQESLPISDSLVEYCLNAKKWCSTVDGLQLNKTSKNLSIESIQEIQKSQLSLKDVSNEAVLKTLNVSPWIFNARLKKTYMHCTTIILQPNPPQITFIEAKLQKLSELS